MDTTRALTLTGARSFTIEIGPALSSEVIPHVFSPASDFNGDGVLHFDSDFAAFMSAFNDEEFITDRDWNSIWDQADIDAWIETFNEDFANLP